MAFTITVSGDCRGCGACEALCPGGFELVDGRSEPRDPIEASLDEVRDVADRCPGGAISVGEGTQVGEASLGEVLRRADAAGVEGAALWVERVGGRSGVDRPMAAAGSTNSDADGFTGEEHRKRRVGVEEASGGDLVELLYQGGIVAAIVLVTGYLALG